VFLSKTKSRPKKFTADKLQVLADLGLEWAMAWHRATVDLTMAGFGPPRRGWFVRALVPRRPGAPAGRRASPTLDAPVHGRAALAANIHRNQDRQERDGTQLRHWIGMLDVDVRPDGTLRTCTYALVYVPPRGGTSTVSRVCVMEDGLVRCCGKWRVRHRVVNRDGLPADEPGQVGDAA
jgi:hypothetical protein